MTTALYLPEENIGKCHQLTSVKNRSAARAANPSGRMLQKMINYECVCILQI